MKAPSLLIAGMVSGILIGSATRYLIPREEAKFPSSEIDTTTRIDRATEQTADVLEPRPTLEEVCQAPSAKAASILSRYLENATIEECIELADIMTETSALPYPEHRWMIQVRGLELDPQTLLTWAREHRKSSSFFSSLYYVWAVMDPYTALEASMKEDHSSRATEIVLREMKNGDPKRALAAVKALMPRSAVVEELEGLIWESLAKRDPRGALKEASTIEDVEERKQALKSVAKVWAEQDPKAVVDWVESQGDLDENDELKILAIGKLAETQPDLAYRYVEKVAPSRDRLVLQGKVAKELATKDPAGAINWLKSLPEDAPQGHLMASMISELELEPVELISLITELNIDVRQSDNVDEVRISATLNRPETYHRNTKGLSDEVNRAILEIAEESPQQALESLYAIDGYDTSSCRMVAEVWVEQDAEAALDWAASLLDGSEAVQVPANPDPFARSFESSASIAKDAIFSTLAAKAPEEMATYFTDRGITPSQTVSDTIAYEWAKRDANAAFEWIDQLNGDLKQNTLMTALHSTVVDDPIVTLHHVNKIEDAQTQYQIIEAATRDWRQQDPQGAMRWLERQPPEAGTDDILIQASKEWVLERPLEASQWINAMESSPRKDQAVVGMIDAVTTPENPNKDFTAAEVWLQTIADPELQQHWIDELATRR